MFFFVIKYEIWHFRYSKAYAYLPARVPALLISLAHVFCLGFLMKREYPSFDVLIVLKIFDRFF